MPVFFTILRVIFITLAIVIWRYCFNRKSMVHDLFFLDGVVLDVHVKHSPQLQLNECYRGFHSGALFLVEADGHSIYFLGDFWGQWVELSVNGWGAFGARDHQARRHLTSLLLLDSFAQVTKHAAKLFWDLCGYVFKLCWRLSKECIQVSIDLTIVLLYSFINHSVVLFHIFVDYFLLFLSHFKFSLSLIANISRTLETFLLL